MPKKKTWHQADTIQEWIYITGIKQESVILLYIKMGYAAMTANESETERTEKRDRVKF